MTLRYSNVSITIEYGTNNARVKSDFQDPNKIKLIFPAPLAETLGVNHKYFNQPIGNERYAFHTVSI